MSTFASLDFPRDCGWTELVYMCASLIHVTKLAYAVIIHSFTHSLTSCVLRSLMRPPQHLPSNLKSSLVAPISDPTYLRKHLILIWLSKASVPGRALRAELATTAPVSLSPQPPSLLSLPLSSPCRMAVPISVSNPDLLRHSTELFMDSGFSPLCQRMGAMVAFRRFEEFTR